MAVFIELVTDAFHSHWGKELADSALSSRAGTPFARRPMRGLEIKEDTYAMLKVVAADGTPIPLIDSNVGPSGNTTGYTNFIIQQVTETRMEKHKILETFGESYLFFFGEAPRFLDVSAVLINSHDFNWEAEWWENYEYYLRGTRLAEMGARCYLFYDDNIVEGYIILANATKDAMRPLEVQLRFKFFVSNYSNVSLIGDDNFPVRSSVVLPDNVVLTKGNAAYELLRSAYGGDIYEEKIGTVLNEIGIGSVGPTPEGGFKKISDAFRDAARSYAFSPDVFKALESASWADEWELDKYVKRFRIPLRGKISDNVDEFTGGYPAPDFFFSSEAQEVPAAQSNIIRTQQEANDLFLQAIELLACYGADVNNPSAMSGLGFSASFSASAGASFGPTSSGGIGFSSSSKATAKAGFGSGGSPDPLSNVYGPPAGSTTVKDSKYYQGQNGYYGYSSQYTTGPGYASAEWGAFGGAGYGSGFGSTGDPGHIAPEKFTYAGTADSRSAYERFVAPSQDPTSFGTGVSLSASASVGVGSSGAYAKASAAYSVGSKAGSATVISGSPSSFSMISTGGSLSAGGGVNASAKAGASASTAGFAASAQASASASFGIGVGSPGGSCG